MNKKVVRTFNARSISSGDKKNTLDSYGNEFRYSINGGIKMPGDSCIMKITFSSVWFNTPNITSGVNNKLYFTIGSGSETSISIPTGLYSVTTLSSMIVTLLENSSIDSTAFTLGANDATQKVYLRAGDEDVEFNFTHSDTIRDILGFDSGTVSVSSETSEFGDNIANFNTLNQYLIHCDKVDGGINYDGTSSDIIDVINIPAGTSVGSQVISEKIDPTVIYADSFCKSVDNILFRITDQDNNKIDTLGEEWNISFKLISTYNDIIKRNIDEKNK